MKVLGYYFRSARLEPIVERQSDTVVIFVHGILSKSKDAFKQSDQDGYFWDFIKDVYPFSSFDFAIFSYGKIDVSYILEKDWPINNLTRISTELNGAISKYKNVVFLAHSQGGLLAKTYSSLYYQQQGIFLTTLHTPHRNKSITVMRVNDKKIWDDYASFYISHMFCGSINDNKIVKPDNALTGCKDIKYISYDTTKKSLGHSHLSQNPDPDFIWNLKNHASIFLNSGLNRKFYILPETPVDKKVNVELIFSRSNLKLDKHLNKANVIPDPWNSQYFHANTAISSKVIVQNGCSVNYFLRHLRNTDSGIVSLTDIDSIYPDSIVKTEEKLYTLCFGDLYSEKNPYRNIPFFISDFQKKSLIINDDFFDIFLCRLKKEKTKNTDFRSIYKSYNLSMIDFRRTICRNAYSSSAIKKDMSIGKYEVIVISSVNKILKLPEKRSEYLVVHKIIKEAFYNKGYCIPLRDIEVVISVLMRSDGELYWLDRDVCLVFKQTK